MNFSKDLQGVVCTCTDIKSANLETSNFAQVLPVL